MGAPTKAPMKTVSFTELRTLGKQARASARGRANLNVHTGPEDAVQRFFNAMQPGTYVHPHRHREAGKWELFVVLSGEVSALTFDEDGTVTARATLGADAAAPLVEVAEHTWHTLVCHRPGTVVFEVKRGPYDPVTDKEFAPWAPAAESADADAYQRWLETAQPGDRY
jgi:cupin fold WbuC family metalloprotein